MQLCRLDKGPFMRNMAHEPVSTLHYITHGQAASHGTWTNRWQCTTKAYGCGGIGLPQTPSIDSARAFNGLFAELVESSFCSVVG